MASLLMIGFIGLKIMILTNQWQLFTLQNSDINMALNKSKGNMYEFITHTWNTVKGKCPYDCGYCCMKGMAKRFNKPQSPIAFDRCELKTNLGKGNFIFVGSSNDLFSASIPAEWVFETLDHCDRFDNKYLFQSKNPLGFARLAVHPAAKKSVICTSLESNRFYPEFMGFTLHPEQRAADMSNITEIEEKYITVEPVMDFDLGKFVEIIKACSPRQVNIGADSGNNRLPEPPKEKILKLVEELSRFTEVKVKSNLRRIMT
jgi:hypothetical protein